MKLNQKIVDGLQLPTGKRDAIIWDDDVGGLGVRLQGRAKRWVLRYRVAGDDRQRQVTLGHVAGVPLKEARKAASQHLADARTGIDRDKALKAEAVAARREQMLKDDSRLDGLIHGYLAYAERELRPATVRALRRSLLRYWAPFHGRSVGELTKREVVGRLETIAEDSGGVSANRAKSHLSACMSWAMRRGQIEAHPLLGVAAVRSETPRDRVLSADEIVRIWRETAKPTDFNRVLRLLFLTGQRRSEVAGLGWAELDLQRRLWVLPARRAKNRREHAVPLCERAAAILEAQPRKDGRDFVFGLGSRGFNGFHQPKVLLDERTGLSGWTIHDVRRSVATGMAEIGIRPDDIEMVLNHAGRLNAIAKIYNQYDGLKEKTAALQRWADHLARIVGEGEASVVVPLRSGA